MTPEGFDRWIARQSGLIAALDAGDADAILAASNALAEALNASRSGGAPTKRSQVGYGLKIADGARIGVKYLTAWNRQKIDGSPNCAGKRSIQPIQSLGFLRFERSSAKLA